ncbi:hypothetical protein J4467_01595 [Candidatus Woesearchaeota archaeon]|nr:hypothetical protein [Candidatus Woesearchaeota archaeon]
MVFIDMHVHSKSSDGTASVKELLSVSKKLKTGLSITDHNIITGSIEACKDKDALVIPGIEIGSNRFNHLLAYFYDINELKEFYQKEILPFKIKHRFHLYRTKLPLLKLLEISKNYNCITSAAHPSVKTLTWTKKPLLMVDAIEVLNSSIPSKYNQKAFSLSDSLKKLKTAGSDAHSIRHLNSGGIISNEDTVEGILNSIKKNKNKVTGTSYTTLQNFRHKLITSNEVFRVKKK